MKKVQLLFGLCILSSCVTLSSDLQTGIFDFAFPWDDASRTITDVSALNAAPAGQNGRVQAGANGHLFVGDDRIRFLGVNVTIGDCYPERSEADAIAGRLAKFGINLVRIHLVDYPHGAPSVIDYERRDSRHLDAKNFDRLEYFVSALKRNGIYVLLPLLGMRRFSSGDGLPASTDKMDPKDQQIPAMFDSRMLELQKEYARSFLGRRRSSSGGSFIDDPAVAFVEVLNEQGLVHGWRNGRMDVLPVEFRYGLGVMWDEYLAEKYGSFAALKRSWGDVSEPLSAKDIANGDFASGSLSPWWLSVQAPAGATSSVVQRGYGAGVNAVNVRVTDASDVDWRVQLGCSTSVIAGHPYTIRFSAKAFPGARVSVRVTEKGGSWEVLYQEDVALTEAWQDFEFTFVSPVSRPEVIFSFVGFSARRGDYGIARVSFRQGGTRPGLLPTESGFSKIGIFLNADSWLRTTTAKRDWVSFLLRKEREYWTAMDRFLKDELHCQALTLGTQVGFSVPSLMSEFDIVDSHGYWQYPAAERNWWDSPWWVSNESMIGQVDGGAIGELSAKRVAGKPFMVSEYNHPFPNSFGAEAYLVLSTYAALQDWDAIIAYQYGDGKGDPQDGMIDEFFEMANDVGKWASMPHAALIFRRGDVSAARRVVAVPVRDSDETAALPGAAALKLVDASVAGVPGRAALVHRIAMVVGGDTVPADALDAAGVRETDRREMRSDTGEVLWDTSARTMIVNTERTKVVAGRCTGQTFELGGITIRPRTALQGWTVISMSLLEGDALARGAAKILLTACGVSSNTGVAYRLYPSGESAGFPPSAGVNIAYASPGTAPTVTEGIGAEIRLPYPASQVRVHALDAMGAPKATVPVTTERGGAAFVIDAAQRTIWYQVEIVPAAR
jgi:hypothetical protein